MTSYMPQALTDQWATPQALFDEWDAKYKFDLDPAASSSNHKCDLWYGLDHPDPARRDGLSATWTASAVWLNPPYGRPIGDWAKKAFESELDTVLLLPVRTDTRWFHTYCKRYPITFIRGRVKFGDSKNSAPFPSMIVEMVGR
jgi:site-specific DNA-methyltransferase (adenine-specific)